MLSSGVVLSGRYRLDDRVATGGMGDVWRATDQILGRQVAVKVLLPALVSDPDFIARFRTEARIMAALRHPGIVQVYDCGEDDLPDGGRADYLVMEFVEGQPLSRRIEAAGQLDVAETMSIVAQAAQALHAAHLGGIVHRDVKPSNLLVQEDGTVVLVDFGVARSTNVTSITSADAVPGTALYMAPEQAAGRPVSGATDIYALGAVAYCCLTGGPPFTGDNPLQVAVRHLDDEPPELPQEIPASVRQLVGRALAKDPAERFATGAAMAEAARATVADGSAPTSTVPVPLRGAAGGGAAPGASGTTRDDLPPVRRPAPSFARRGGRRGTLLGALAAVLVAVAGLTAALGATRGDDAPATKYQPTASAAVPTQGDNSAATEEAAVDEGPTDRPGRRPSAPASPTATPKPSGSATPKPSSTPTASAPVDPPPTTASTPADPPPTTASTPADPPPTTASTPADPPVLNG
ncbi:protein kinase domain-containing protein [Micromonospora sp. CA-111912]|uniref:serine/threonine-protein kinase n=1 Tax=Micromonospora sp. CA-111912 TaxID=3239955 RepID=UPI003D8B5366